MALIQTRVSNKTERWVERQAKKAGLSKAAWLRNHLETMRTQEKKAKAQKLRDFPPEQVEAEISRLQKQLDRLSRDEESE